MPIVSIIVPCYNEQATINSLLEAIYAQEYPRTEMEVIISDGMSTDSTRTVISAFQRAHPDLAIRVIDNRARTIPSGLNLAIDAALGRYILRLDAHCVPYPDYVARSIRALEDGLGSNVGGVWVIRPGADDWVAASIAAAAAHPLGVGDALYRHATQAAVVDTVPFGAYRKSLVDEIGKYDESLLTNEDYEFNTRIRQAGGRLWLDPEIRSVYFARATLGALARQYWRYGFWKWRMLQRYPGTLRWRQALPPLFVLGLVVGVLLSLFFSVLWYLVIVVSILYFLALFFAALQTAVRRRQACLLFGLPLAIPVMHVSWGSGFLWSMFKSFGDPQRG